MEELYHYGTPRHSGRYPWGSGDNPFQHEDWFLNRVQAAKNTGLKTDKEIADSLGLSVSEFRAKRSIASAEYRHFRISTARKLVKECNGNKSEAARRMGINESTLRTLLDAEKQEKATMTANLASDLKRAVDSSGGYLMVGEGTNLYLDGISEDRMKTAISMLTEKGYKLENLKIPQMEDKSKKTTVQVLCPPGVESKKEIYDHLDKITTLTDFTVKEDKITEGEEAGFKVGKRGIYPPVSIDSSRVGVVYDEDGGSQRDGVVYLRRGVEDISLGLSNYAQVRIAVDGTHYIKGMAMYGDDSDFPPGKDIIVFSNKSRGTPLLGEESTKSVLKLMERDKNGEIDYDNPFKANLDIKGQRLYDGEDGKKHLSVINKVNDEGTWGEWSRTLSSQFLSKQPLELIKSQLSLAYDKQKTEYEEIMSLTNPVLKRKLLREFADDCDSAAEELKGAALPRQGQFVILPVPDLPDGQVYAPQYNNGEKVCLIRHPHQGTFEIPELTVNNNFPSAVKSLGKTPSDAIGINLNTANMLSGADFDGDSVIVIPVNDRVRITNAMNSNDKAYEELRYFNPKKAYPAYPGMPKVCKENGWDQDQQMGKASNLVTDMTLKGAPPEDIVKAVKYAQVVIDAQKHQLDHKQAYKDCEIAELKKEYQGKASGGASTLISRAKSPDYILEIEESLRKGDIDPETGIRKYNETGRTYNKKNPKTGEWEKELSRTKTTKMASALRKYGVSDSLSSGTAKEAPYADYANHLYLLANEARKSYLASFKDIQKANPAAKETYKAEVESLNKRLTAALKNAPRERMAQIQANIILNDYKKNDPTLFTDNSRKKELAKLRRQLILGTRHAYGASGKDTRIRFSDREWQAIQANAISPSRLEILLEKSDSDWVRKLATPKPERGLSVTQKAQIRSMRNSGRYTLKEMADVLGVSTTTVSKAIKEL